MLRRFLFALVTLVAAGVAHAQTPTPTGPPAEYDGTCGYEKSNGRGIFGTVIWLFGDSFSRGFQLLPTTKFPDQYSDAEITTEKAASRWRARSVQSMINLALEGAGEISSANFDWRDYVMAATTVATYCGSPGLPDNGSGIDTFKTNNPGDLSAGDFISIEDAGDHNSDPPSYLTYQRQLRSDAVSALAATSIQLTMAYYGTDQTYDYQHWFAPYNHNDSATRLAATESQPGFTGSSVLLEMKSFWDSERTRFLATYNVDIFQTDTIHPNVWGGCIWAGHILAAAGLQPTIAGAGVTAFADYMKVAWADWDYGTGNGAWTQNAVATEAAKCIGVTPTPTPTATVTPRAGCCDCTAARAQKGVSSTGPTTTGAGLPNDLQCVAPTEENCPGDCVFTVNAACVEVP